MAALLVEAVMVRTGAGGGTAHATGAVRFGAPAVVARAAGTSDAPAALASAAALAAPGRRRIWAGVEEAVAAAPPGSPRASPLA